MSDRNKNLNHPVSETISQGEKTMAASKNTPSFNPTDKGNAQRLQHYYGSDLRYCWPWKKWLVWDGKRWREDCNGTVQEMTKQLQSRILAEAAHEKDTERQQELRQWAKATEMSGRISAAIKLARSENDIPVHPDQLDKNPWSLNLMNGTLDLRTGHLHEHRREDLLTKMAPVEFDPNAKCPNWDAFLATITDGNEELIGYLQRAAGMSMTGVIRDHVLFFVFGRGANGKSTFINTLLKVLGTDYAMKAPSCDFGKRA